MLKIRSLSSRCFPDWQGKELAVCPFVFNVRALRSWLVRVGFWRCVVCGVELSVSNCSEVLNVCCLCERSLGS
jgi:hypothetical protein